MVTGKQVLLLEADAMMQRQLSRLLEEWGYVPTPARSVEEAGTALARTQFLFSLVDEGPTGADGVDFLRKLGTQGGDPGPIIMLCDPTNRSWISAAKALGANELVHKPLNREALEKAIAKVLSNPHRAWEQSLLESSSGGLQEEIALWRSPKMQEVREIIQQAGQVDVPVLVCGETGTGKDLVVRAIHHLSRRQGQPFVKVSCAAVPRELLESEMFGQERGAFVGRLQLKIGKFESADHGTIFLDEIGELPPALQAKLLNFLQDGEFARVGGKSTIKVDVRIIAATKQDLARSVGAGRFREDLYYRLNVIQIVIPPLRERPEEIPLLINYFTERYSKQFHREGFTLPPNVIGELVRHRYPGNIRELENLIKRMIVLNDPFIPETPVSRVEVEAAGGGTPGPVDLQARSLKEIGREAARAAEREAIARALEHTGWNRMKAAKLLKISYRALLYKIKDAGLREAARARSQHPSA